MLDEHKRLYSLLDWAERILILLLFAAMIARIGASLPERPFNILILISDGLAVGFTLFRRRAALVSLKPLDWAAALGGTMFSLLASAGGDPLVPQGFGVAIMVAGLAVNIWSKLALNRSFGLAAANRGVKNGGPYRFVRHPMYLGYAVTWLGFWLLNPTWRNAAVYLAAGACQIVRILAEERVLSQDPAYAAMMDKTRHRLIPGVF